MATPSEPPKSTLDITGLPAANAGGDAPTLAICPDCGQEVLVGGDPAVGQVVICGRRVPFLPECGTPVGCKGPEFDE